MIKGIDVSKWQGTIDWQKVKDSGIQFAILREGYGKENPAQVDKKFEENYQNAKKVGLPVGVYHYSYADSVEDARAEARFCLKNIKGKQLEYPIVFDIEDKEQLKLTSQQRTDICQAFCQEIEKAGYYAMIYCNLDWYKNKLLSEQLASYDLWLAQWDVDKPSAICGIWQTSEKGQVSGITGNVDMNVAYKDYPSIMKKKKLNGFCGATSPAPQTKSSYSNYIVLKGDTLSSIATKFDTTVSQLASLNNITNVNRIYVGQLMKVPSSNATYTIKKGDTLSSIAKQYQTTVDKLAQLNDIPNKNLLYPGQVIKVK